MTAVHGYTWDWFDSAGNNGLLTVFPTGGGLSKTIMVRPDGSATATARATTAANTADAFLLANQRIAMRLFLELWPQGGENFLAYDQNDFDDPDNWWFNTTPYVVPAIPQVTLDFWATFGAAWRARSVSSQLAYLVGEEEQELGFDGIRGIQNRTDFFEPITSDTNSPYFGLTNIGSPSSHPLAAQFRNEYNDWGYFHKAAILRQMHGPILSATPVPADSGRMWTNYKDRPAGNLAGRFAPEFYYYVNPSQAVPAGFTTAKQVGNMRRWIDFLSDINELRSFAGHESNGEIDPWVAPPGFGVAAAFAASNQTFGTWCVPAALPFETILWRAAMEHLHALGCKIHIIWNPSADPNRAANCVTMDAYYGQQHETTAVVRNLPQVASGALTFTTTGNGRSFTSGYEHLFNLSVIYYRRVSGTLPVPYLNGWPWSQADPLMISAGAAGDTELTDLIAAYTLTQDTTPTAREAASNRSRVRMRSR